MKEYFECAEKMVLLDIPYPHEAMLAEARALSDRYVVHRGQDAYGWEGLTLHGLGEDKTEPMSFYGYTDWREGVRHMGWTDVAKECPVTLDFLLNRFPSRQFGRVRFMKLRPGGYISRHSDSSVPVIENLNLVLNNPKGCVWQWADEPAFEMEPGKAYAMNIHYEHAFYNHSLEDRYHMIIERHDTTEEWKQLLARAGARGRYFEYDVLY